MSFFSQNTASCFALLTYSSTSGQADTFSQPWVSGAAPQITDATGKGFHTGFTTLTNNATGAVANINNQAERSHFAQFWGNISSAYAGSDDAWVGYGRGASYVVQSQAGSSYVLDPDRSRSIIMRSE